MSKFSGLVKGVAAVLMAAGLLAGSAIPATASTAIPTIHKMDTGWG
ncbi:MAG TPA: hypothetical protein VFO98_04175 [Marmoricola sp.]|jgi:hypothetical protein|nr:hypothetical protein [Marmoricola sp.]